MSFVTAALIVGGASLASGYMGSQAAKKAAGETAAGTRYATDVQREMFDIARADLAPYREAGYTALEDLSALKPFLTSQFGPEQFQQYLDPSMDFRMRLGQQATERLGNVSGGAISGNTLRSLQDYGQGLASTEYGNAFNRFQTERGNIYNTLYGMAGLGSGATTTGVNVGQQTAQNIGQLAVGGAQAQAAGTIGAANAWGGAANNIADFGSLYALAKSGAFKAA